LKAAHEALLEPPSKIKEDPEALAKWRPAVRAQVDWEAIERDNASGPMATALAMHELDDRDPANDTELTPDHRTDEDAPSEYLEDKFLTIGLIGMY
jgi:hypothetical protein